MEHSRLPVVYPRSLLSFVPREALCLRCRPLNCTRHYSVPRRPPQLTLDGNRARLIWESGKEWETLRVIAGVARGRNLVSVPGRGTRPITDRVKRALFDILGSDIEGAAFLDLFAGTGSVGIEALSRGASSATFVDRSRKAIDTVRRNLRATGLGEQAEVIHKDVFRYIATTPPGPSFDYIYVAPPQYLGLWAKTLLALHEKPLLAIDGQVIVQIYPKEFHEIDAPPLQLMQTRRYGSTMLCFYSNSTRGVSPPLDDAS